MRNEECGVGSVECGVETQCLRLGVGSCSAHVIPSGDMGFLVKRYGSHGKSKVFAAQNPIFAQNRKRLTKSHFGVWKRKHGENTGSSLRGWGKSRIFAVGNSNGGIL